MLEEQHNVLSSFPLNILFPLLIVIIDIKCNWNATPSSNIIYLLI